MNRTPVKTGPLKDSLTFIKDPCDMVARISELRVHGAERWSVSQGAWGQWGNYREPRH